MLANFMFSSSKTEKKRLVAGTSYITFLIYLKAYLWTKNERNRFSTLAPQCSIFPDRLESEAWKCSQTFNFSLGEK